MARFGLKGLFGRGIKKYLRVLHARKSSGQENNSNGHQKLETWGAKIFFGPSSDFFHQKAKRLPKFMQIWMVANKKYQVCSLILFFLQKMYSFCRTHYSSTSGHKMIWIRLTFSSLSKNLLQKKLSGFLKCLFELIISEFPKLTLSSKNSHKLWGNFL